MKPINPNKKYMPKKSLYVFLTSLLGVLLFLILHRVAVFFYLYMLAGGYLSSGLEYAEFLALDYSSMTIILMLGSWYGIWLGLGWYEQVYERQSHGGFVSHLANRIFWNGRDEKLAVKLVEVKRRLDADIGKLEVLANSAAERIPFTSKKKTVTKRPKITA